MPGLRAAKLYELDAAFEKEKPNGKKALVQFNPETLRVSYANQIRSPAGNAGDPKEGTASRQYMGAGTTKLSLQLWFDVTAPMPGNAPAVDDVRRLTQKVTDLMNPVKAEKDPNAYVPPAVRFEWGTFKFDGIIDSLEESLEFFSPDGKPLRASMSLNMSQQKILQVAFGQNGPLPGRRPSPGTEPLTAAPAGATLQALASQAGSGPDWQRIAEANGIENPRQLRPGQLIDLAARRLPG